MIRRDKYLDQLISARDNGFPKVITGIRRCGKSYLLKEIYRDYLLSDGIKKDDIIILEMDDDRNITYRDPLLLGSYVRELCSEKGKFQETKVDKFMREAILQVGYIYGINI